MKEFVVEMLVQNVMLGTQWITVSVPDDTADGDVEPLVWRNADLIVDKRQIGFEQCDVKMLDILDYFDAADVPPGAVTYSFRRNEEGTLKLESAVKTKCRSWPNLLDHTPWRAAAATPGRNRLS
jgi:hypothetical protein